MKNLSYFKRFFQKIICKQQRLSGLEWLLIIHLALVAAMFGFGIGLNDK
jgi:hypothetical protein